MLVTADDVENGKPAPDGYLAAAAALGVRPRVTVVLEDSASGVESARAAGVGAVVGVGDRALETDADVVVPDLRALFWNGTGIAARSGDLLRRGLEPSSPSDTYSTRSDTYFTRSDTYALLEAVISRTSAYRRRMAGTA